MLMAPCGELFPIFVALLHSIFYCCQMEMLSHVWNPLQKKTRTKTASDCEHELSETTSSFGKFTIAVL